MDLNIIPTKENILHKEKDSNMNYSESQINNIETTESINPPNQNNQNQEEKNDIITSKKTTKLSHLINKNNSPSFMLKNQFNKWKYITFLKEKRLGRKAKKILIKKTMNIHQAKKNKDSSDKERSKIIIMKKQANINLNEEMERMKKIIKFFESRIMSYFNKKKVMKKYYTIWLSKTRNLQLTNENAYDILYSTEKHGYGKPKSKKR